MEEIWKPIKNYEKLYKISNFGRVISLRRNIIMKFTTANRGYYKIILSDNKKIKNFIIHTLVWDHFGNGKRNGRKLQVDHIDNNKLNNRIDNLQLLTCAENINKSRKIIKKSRYTGVYYQDDCNRKWRSMICLNNKLRVIGSYYTEEEARDAYNVELKNREGNNSNL